MRRVSYFFLRLDSHALPHVKSNPKEGMPQDKNRTIRKLNNTGRTFYRSTYGVKFERQTEANNGNSQKIPYGKKSEKIKILFTFIEQTGYNRKYAIHILANEGKSKTVIKGLKEKIT
jgi:hypothetical protein